jgi:tetratricopeptide (TPR) repeat protein
MFLYAYTKNIKELDIAIEILEKEISIDSSEEYALLAYIKAYKMSAVKDKQMLLNLYFESKQMVEKSLELNKDKPRALYVKTLLDYYSKSNKKKKKIKQQLEEVLNIYKNKSSVESDYHEINWGANLAYELLIKYYLKLEKVKQAKKIYKDAIKKFPNDYLIN